MSVRSILLRAGLGMYGMCALLFALDELSSAYIAHNIADAYRPEGVP